MIRFISIWLRLPIDRRAASRLEYLLFACIIALSIVEICR
jgi:hypothetical protein